MNFIVLLATLSTFHQQAETSVFDQPIGEMRGEQARGPLDRMSLNQMMRMTALPEARLNELKCAGVANWSGSKAWPVFALADNQRSEFIGRVAAALANDIEMEKDIAVGLIDTYAEEPSYQEKQGKLPSWRSVVEKDCASLIVQVRSGTYQLAPLAQPSVVNTTLATCYARYTLAAEDAKDEQEAKSLRATAAKAEAQALAGKEGDALSKARAALADRLSAGRNESPTEDGDDMMKLVMCLPAMEAAAKEQAK